MTSLIKISVTGAALPEDATDFVALLNPETKRMWTAHDLSFEGDEEFGHAEAENACAGLELAGFKDWYCPSVEELFALADRSRHSPAADPLLNMKSGWYWSSTSAAWSREFAWGVGFSLGEANCDHRYHYARVRAVRVASQ